tara:strand:+ start:159 stop:905 length:747 start_codon:yes stop_codon:yes gene_type:complete
MATTLSGTSGALYYKPAGTDSTFKAANVTNANNTINVGTFLNFKLNDKVSVGIGTGGTLPGGLAASTPVFIRTYVAATGLATFAATVGAAELALSNDGVDGTTPFTIKYTDFEAVGDVREWNFEITRDEYDVTTIGQTLGQFAPFKTYITGFADGSGSATIYTTDDDTSIASRLVEDVIQRQQAGVQLKLYVDRVVSSGTVDDSASRSITLEAVLTSASLSVTPDDAQSIEVSFRPSAVPTFDFSKSA